MLFVVWFLTTDEVPRDFTGMTPYVATLFVLALAAQRLRMPAADGLVYRKGIGRLMAMPEVRLGRALQGGGGRRRCAVPTRRTPTTRSAPPPSSTTAGVVVRLQRRERVVRRRAVRRVRDGLAAARQRRGRLTHSLCVNGDGDVIMPCGRCRQLLFEAGGPDLLLLTVTGVRRMAEVLPDAFGPDALDLA